jgi:hypothetical protein
MGNTSNYILVLLAIYLFTGIIALGIQSIDPSSNLLLSNKLFNYIGNTNNVVVANVQHNGSIAYYTYNNSQFDSMGSQTSLVSITSQLIPDWIGSGLKYLINAGRTYINFIGAPYTIMASLQLDPDLSALIGSFFGIFGTFILLNWILGRDN